MWSYLLSYDFIVALKFPESKRIMNGEASVGRLVCCFSDYAILLLTPRRFEYDEEV